MLCLRNYLTGDWLRTAVAQRIYLIASIGTAIYTVAVIVSVYPVTGHNAALLLVPFFVLGALCRATIWLGMLYYWFVFDRGTRVIRTIWCLGLLLFPIISIAYYFRIYRREVAAHIATATPLV